jgi:GNAT superfamily N-acetyltransferase
MTAPASATVLVRPATLDDSAAIAELSGQLGSPSTTEQVQKRLLLFSGEHLRTVLVAELPASGGPSESRGSIIGWMQVEKRLLVHLDPRAEVVALVVAEGHRRRGAGRALMQRAEEWAAEHDCRAVYLRSNVFRTWAHAFYETLGYRLLKTQKAFLKEL